VWNKTGFALIEKDNEDPLLGISFYGKRSDVDHAVLYTDETGFEIDANNKSYKIIPGNKGILGRTGGQMIALEIFQLDSAFETRVLLEETDKFILQYKFKDLMEFDVIDRFKVVELDKQSFLVIKVIHSYISKGSKALHQIVLSDIKINDEVQSSISKFKSELENFNVIVPEKPEPNPLLNNQIPDIKLPLLDDNNTSINLNTGKLTLLDFWEIWCRPCIKSLPEVEKIKQKYADKIQVIGVVTQNKDRVSEFLKKMNNTLLVLHGDKETLRKFSVNSYPRYFLIDDQGIVRYEYHGFSEQIERDLVELLKN
jgi:thiol-disulfide isomerase/thioredoxin